MDEKTEELRDIFIDVTDESVVTEEQEDERGSLGSEEGSAKVDERLASVITRMRERYDFASEFDDADLCTVVRGFFDGDADADIAGAVGASRHDVFDARMDLHLLRGTDEEAPFDLADLRERLEAGADDAAVADEFGLEESAARRYRRAVEAREEMRQVSERFRDEFEEILTDADLATRMTEEVQEDGLEEATEGSETNVSF